MVARRVVLVTGASRGIGRALALEFARKRYAVGINFVQREREARAVAEEVRRLGGEPQLLKADVGSSGQVREMVKDLLHSQGKIDILVNNAGITRDRTLLKMSDAEWEDVLRADLTGAFFCLRECARAMVRRKDGALLNIGSLVGLRGSVGNANYAAAKAGLIGLTKSAAKELGRFNLRVNAVLPGFHLTEMGSLVWGRKAEAIRQEHVLERLTDLEELARFVVFVAEQRSASGQVFNFESRVI